MDSRAADSKNMKTIYIDDKAFEVKSGENLLQAVLGLGLDLPYFCWHPAMGSVGACRQCALVQYLDNKDTRGRIVMACMTPVTDGARFSMQGSAASEFRNNIIEALMLNHPHDCPVCAEGGECHLQDMTMMVGHRNRSYRGKKNTHYNQYLGPLIHHEMNRCISCYRCTRYYNDYAGGTDLTAQASADHVYFGRHQDGVLESEFAGNLVEVCPTGVFTDKPFVNEYTRKWDLQSAPSICTGCALGCNILPGERYGRLKRIHNRYNSQVNGYFLCDRGRFGGSHVNDEKRPLFAGLRNSSGLYDAIDKIQAIDQFAKWCSAGNTVVGIGSPRASLETNYLLKRLVGENNYCSGMAEHEEQLVARIRSVLQNGSVSTPSMKQVESADAILVLGEDVTNTAPRLALALRQSVRNLANQMATDTGIPLWQDAAVRNLAQDQLSPLFIAATSDTRLDDVAEKSVYLQPSDIARLGYAIAANIDPGIASIDDLDSETRELAARVAGVLRSAKRPLIVSGTGAQSLAVINAAAAIAQALNHSEAMLGFCLPECNTMGLALMQDDSTLSLADISQRAINGEVDTLVVVENDLYRRGPGKLIEKIISSVVNIVVIDSLETATLSQSSLALPAASFAEAQGTLVSCEGRAQRHYPVFRPAEQRQASWQWLVQLGQALNKDGFNELDHFDSVTAACASSQHTLTNIIQASPAADFRDRGMKIPRQTHRYSGRTAMRADISVHEPKQPVDEDTPLAFSMEGVNAGKSGALIPYVWAPGWNSNQSVHKFQSEAGGVLSGGTPGIRLVEASGDALTSSIAKLPDKFSPLEGVFRLLPLFRIFGSEELSARSPAIAKLTAGPFIQINSDDAKQLGVVDGDLVKAQIDNADVELMVEVRSSIPRGCAGYACGLPGARWLAPGSTTSLRKSASKPVVKQGGTDV